MDIPYKIFDNDNIQIAGLFAGHGMLSYQSAVANDLEIHVSFQKIENRCHADDIDYTRSQFYYAIRGLIVRSHKVSKLCD